MITKKEVRELFSYDPETGKLTWKSPRAHRVKVGDIVGWHEPGRYVRVNIGGTLYYAHRLIFLYMTGRWPKADIDHINGEKSDNRWNNIREATRSENFFNRGITGINTTGYKGVSFDKTRGKFMAVATIRKKTTNLGRFSTAVEAHKAYVDFIEKHHGEFLTQKTKRK